MADNLLLVTAIDLFVLFFLVLFGNDLQNLSDYYIRRFQIKRKVSKHAALRPHKPYGLFGTVTGGGEGRGGHE